MTDQPYLQEADAVAESTNSDVLLLNTPIRYPMDYVVAQMCQDRRRRPNLLFIPVTYGGDAHVAYRLATGLQEQYARVTCYVTGSCKSAGTLVAIGANQLVMADRGELGPLDVQLSKEDEIGERRSGLTALSALETLHQQAFAAFRYFMLQIKFDIGGSITTRTATQIAADLTGKLMQPIYGHIDAMHVGEAGRSLMIAKKYGEILDRKAGNLKGQTLDALTGEYPDHGFVIDRHQAQDLFKSVREPSDVEVVLARKLAGVAIHPIQEGSPPRVAFLSQQSRSHSEEDMHDEIPEDEKTHASARLATARSSNGRAEEPGRVSPSPSHGS